MKCCFVFIFAMIGIMLLGCAAGAHPTITPGQQLAAVRVGTQLAFDVAIDRQCTAGKIDAVMCLTMKKQASALVDTLVDDFKPGAIVDLQKRAEARAAIAEQFARIAKIPIDEASTIVNTIADGIVAALGK